MANLQCTNVIVLCIRQYGKPYELQEYQRLLEIDPYNEVAALVLEGAQCVVIRLMQHVKFELVAFADLTKESQSAFLITGRIAVVRVLIGHNGLLFDRDRLLFTGSVFVPFFRSHLLQRFCEDVAKGFLYLFQIFHSVLSGISCR